MRKEKPPQSRRDIRRNPPDSKPPKWPCWLDEPSRLCAARSALFLCVLGPGEAARPRDQPEFAKNSTRVSLCFIFAVVAGVNLCKCAKYHRITVMSDNSAFEKGAKDGPRQPTRRTVPVGHQKSLPRGSSAVLRRCQATKVALVAGRAGTARSAPPTTSARPARRCKPRAQVLRAPQHVSGRCQRNTS